MSGEGRRNYWLGRWARELRSGRYEQCYGTSYGGGTRRCAEGVLYQLMMDDGLLPQWECLTFATITHARVNGPLARIGIDPYLHIRPVYRMNDAHASFAKIADYIESLIEPPIHRATRDAYPALLVEREKAGATP